MWHIISVTYRYYRNIEKQPLKMKKETMSSIMTENNMEAKLYAELMGLIKFKTKPNQT